MSEAGFARLIASGLGTGYAPKAPGTAGSLAAVLLGMGLLQISPWALVAAATVATAAGLWAIGAARVEGDPGWVVIDEFAGQWIAMLGLWQSGAGMTGALLAFVLFRLFDIVKPGPVGWADRQEGAFGIMADDVIAGAMAGGLVWGAVWRAPGLFAW